MQPADRPWYRRPWLTPVGIVVVSAALGALAASAGPPASAPVPSSTPSTAAPGACDPSYPDLCLDPKVEDYDCQGGLGTGPRYVDGPIRVRPPDQFDLDSDGDGLGCE